MLDAASSPFAFRQNRRGLEPGRAKRDNTGRGIDAVGPIWLSLGRDVQVLSIDPMSSSVIVKSYTHTQVRSCVNTHVM